MIMNKWKAHLIIVAVAAILLSAIVSFLIKPKFRSFAYLYPINLPTLSEESKTEQMLQIIQSMDIKKKLYKALNLGKHYELDSTSKYYFSYLNDEFENNVSFTKTEFEGVGVEVYDTDPYTACNIIDSIIKFYNDKVEALHKKKNYEMVFIKGKELKRKRTEIDSLERLQRDLRIKYGVIDFDAQAKELTRGYMNMLMVGKKGGETGREVDTLMRNLKEKGGDLLSLRSVIWAAYDQLRVIKDEYDKNFTEVQKKITYSLIVSTPYPADKKSYPIRWLIVVGSTLGALIIAFIAIAFIENRKKN